MDRYFTSVPLLDILRYKNHSQGTGTLRTNNIPSNVNFKTDTGMKKLDRGSVDEKVRNDGQVSVVKWFDNKSVMLTSTAHGKHPSDIRKRWSNKHKNYVFYFGSPSKVKTNNWTMGGGSISLIALKAITEFGLSGSDKKSKPFEL
ncbi:DDE_Tnp_1_7 domain-containing protein [Nephila pilipes]|uniref:DDE_Tnp_1_7 domain-containing protein n=1 Tax=Nephila pilipes TaxID=299642 RepID=A0A8X6PUS9_NEPPI|nr:DDE_Tnp_1_7 domain-containing protein [Nephila pilipes]